MTLDAFHQRLTEINVWRRGDERALTNLCCCCWQWEGPCVVRTVSFLGAW